MTNAKLLEALEDIADKERRIREYKRRLRIKGKVTATGKTKRDNITLTVEKDKEEYKFTILQSNKERYALAQKINIGTGISIEGIPTFRTVICTRLKILEKGLAQGKQEKLELFIGAS